MNNAFGKPSGVDLRIKKKLLEGEKNMKTVTENVTDREDRDNWVQISTSPHFIFYKTYIHI